MTYQGGKWLAAKKIVDALEARGAFEGLDLYVEPFCGSCAVAKEAKVKRK